MKDIIQTDDQARAAGKKAQECGKARTTCPLRDYPIKSLRRSWFEGWDASAASFLKVRLPEVRVPEVPTLLHATFWPKDREMPKKYVRPKPVPCPKCRRLLLDTGAQAVVVRSLVDEMAYLWCRGCGERFKMGVAYVS